MNIYGIRSNNLSFSYGNELIFKMRFIVENREIGLIQGESGIENQLF